MLHCTDDINVIVSRVRGLFHDKMEELFMELCGTTESIHWTYCMAFPTE